MALVNEGDLERVMTGAGLSDRTKKKLREANSPPTTTTARGHGAASQDEAPVSDM